MTGSQAPATRIDARHWPCIDFVSDLHLHDQEPETFRAFDFYLTHSPANALFLLGDLFEAWIGDDLLNDPMGAWEKNCVRALAHAAQRMSLFWIPGNRDFLTGSDFLKQACVTLLADPCVLVLPRETCLISHGDALCVEDHAYQTFRAQVRSPQWQKSFLSRPLQERKALALAMRQQSREHQKQQTSFYDVPADLARAWLKKSEATRLIHGHTHRPDDHDLGNGYSRTVLSDWSLTHPPLRAEILRWQQGWSRVSAKIP